MADLPPKTPMPIIQAIETQYNGRRFRSRLEARWAVFFDSLGLDWRYEMEGFTLPSGTRYLPDFWLPEVYLRFGDPGLWIEVKPTHGAVEVAYDTLSEFGCGYPRFAGGDDVLLDESPNRHRFIVLVGEVGIQGHGDGHLEYGPSFPDQYMAWFTCGDCSAVFMHYPGNDGSDICPRCDSPGCVSSSSPRLRAAVTAALSARFDRRG